MSQPITSRTSHSFQSIIYVLLVALVGWCALATPIFSVQTASAQLTKPKPSIPPSIPRSLPPSIPAKPLSNNNAKAATPFQGHVVVNQLLDAQTIFRKEITDGVWDLKPGIKKRLVAIPIAPNVGKESVILTTKSFTMEGGKLLCFFLADDGQSTAQPAAVPTIIDAVGTDKLPVGVPRLAKEITFKTDGTMTWKMERLIFGAKVKETTGPYVLRLNPAELKKLEPKRPAITRDPKVRTANQLKYREELATYNRTRTQLRKLPTEFQGPTPKIVWAIFDVREKTEAISLDGFKPLPWGLDLKLLANLQKFSGGEDKTAVIEPGSLIIRGDKDAYSVENTLKQTLTTIQAAEKSDQGLHNYTLQLISTAMERSGAFDEMKTGDDAFKIANVLLSSKNTQVIGQVIPQLSNNPTAAKQALMAKAVSEGLFDGPAQLATIKGLLTYQQTKPPKELASRIKLTMTFLADNKGASAGDILKLLFDLTKENANNHLRTTLKDGMSFKPFTGKRMDEVYSYVIERSFDHPLATSWLNDKLLVGDDRVLLRTVYLLSKAKIDSDNDANPEDAAKTQPVSSIPTAPGTQAPTVPTLPKRILLPNTTHSIFKAIQHDNKDIKSLAWAALHAFEMKPQSVTSAPTDIHWSTKLLNIALANDPTPEAFVVFLSRHYEPSVDKALLDLIQKAGDKASVAATKAMFGSGRELGSALQKMEAEARYDFGLKFYENIGVDPPFAAGLLRDKSADNQTALWFGQKLSLGLLPNQSDWLVPYKGDESFLVEKILLNDEVQAQGAVGALVAYVGGSASQIFPIVQSLRKDKTVNALDLKKKWAVMRKEIFAKRLKATAGKFNLTMRIVTEHQKGKAPKWSEHKLGTVTLSVTGATVKVGETIGHVPNDKKDTLAISLPTSAMETLPGNPSNKAKLDPSVRSIDLRPNDDGSWSALITQHDGQPLMLILSQK